MPEPQRIAAARRALGRQLAAYRKAAGYSQHQLAPHTGYGRSTIANVEVGRQHVPRAFWQRCENLLKTDGALTTGYDQLQALATHARRLAARAEGQPAGTPGRGAAQLRGPAKRCQTALAQRSLPCSPSGRRIGKSAADTSMRPWSAICTTKSLRGFSAPVTLVKVECCSLKRPP